LDALDNGGSSQARQKRVLGETLKVSASEWVSVQVHRWRQDDVDRLRFGFLSEHNPNLLDEFKIPSCAERCAAGGASGCGPDPSLAAHTHGAIANFEPGNPQPADGVSIPHIRAASQRGLFLQGELQDDFFY
jgi:hypothetical protein